MDARFQADRLIEEPPSARRPVGVGEQYLRRRPRLRAGGRRLEARQRDGVELVNLDASVGNRPHHPRISDDDPSDERPEQPLDGRRIAGRLQHHLIVEPKPSPERDDLVLHKIKALFIDQLAVFQDGNLGGRSWTSIPMTRMLPLLWFPGAGESTRHLRIRARSATGEPSFTSLLSTPS